MKQFLYILGFILLVACSTLSPWPGPGSNGGDFYTSEQDPNRALLVIVSPRDAQDVIISWHSQLWRSTDGGDNWGLVTAPGQFHRELVGLAEGSSQDNLICATADPGQYDKIFCSRDGGVTWITVGPVPKEMLWDVVVAPTKKGRIWQLSRVDLPPGGALYYSDDLGKNWHPSKPDYFRDLFKIISSDEGLLVEYRLSTSFRSPFYCDADLKCMKQGKSKPDDYKTKERYGTAINPYDRTKELFMGPYKNPQELLQWSARIHQEKKKLSVLMVFRIF